MASSIVRTETMFLSFVLQVKGLPTNFFNLIREDTSPVPCVFPDFAVEKLSLSFYGGNLTCSAALKYSQGATTFSLKVRDLL